MCHLPCGSANEEKALYDVFDYLHKQTSAHTPVVGFTHSKFLPTVYTGWWFGKRPGQERAGRRTWTRDDIVIVMIDYHLDYEDRRVRPVVEQLQAALAQAYVENGCQQAEFWITTEQVYRLA